jgi:type IV secretory pathway TrbF-like protein
MTPYVVVVDKLGYALAVRAPNATPAGAEANEVWRVVNL